MLKQHHVQNHSLRIMREHINEKKTDQIYVYICFKKKRLNLRYLKVDCKTIKNPVDFTVKATGC